MINKFLKTVKDYNMFKTGDKVVVGLSGGPDSMCLISLLLKFRNELGITVEAAHVNHCIRGEEADRDEKFCREFCHSANIPLHVLKTDVPAVAAEKKISTELAARDIRYGFFDSLECDKIATAHTGSDAVETMLMNLSRGASLHGLASIPPVRGKIVRPVISLTRTEIELYCKQNSISYVVDSTNSGNDYTRNKFRHNIIPEFAAINPEFETSALRCIGLLRDEDRFFSDYARKILKENILADGSLSTENVVSLDRCIITRVLAAYISEFTGADYEMSHISLLADHIGEKFSVVLPGNIKMSADGSRLFKDVELSPVFQEKIRIDKYNLFDVRFLNKTFSFIKTDNLSDKKNSCIILDFNKISDSFYIRLKEPGDKITLSRRKCTKSLKKLFNEMKIPVEIRNKTAVFCDEDGVIFVDNIGIDASRRPDASTKEFLIIKSE